MDSALVSEPTTCVTLFSLSGLLTGAVDEEESEERNGAFIVGDVGLGVMSREGSTAGMASEMLGERGPISGLSLIEYTIFSKPKDVMCFSLPREFATIVGELRCREDRISTGEVGGDRDSSESSESSDDSESTLFDSSGKSFRLGLGLAISIAGVVASCGCVSQQSVSRFQMRQLRFSSLRPFSIESAHFEKTEGLISYLIAPWCNIRAHHSTCQTDSQRFSYRPRASFRRRWIALGSLT